MINETEKPCFGPGRCVYQAADRADVLEMQKDNFTWYIAQPGVFTMLLYREKTPAELVAARRQFAATLDKI